MNVEKLSLILAKEIVTDNNPDDIELIRYGLEGILSTLINTIIALIISLLMHKTYEFLLLCITFIPIRCMHKGYHCSTLLSCTVFSNIMIIIATNILYSMTLRSWMLMGIILLAFLHYLISKEKNYYILIFSILVFYTSLYFNNAISCSIFLSLGLNTLLILGGRLHEKTII